MLLPRLQLLLFAARSALAFKNASPFLLLSSDPLSKDAPLQSSQVAFTQDIENRLIDTLSACEKKAYYIVSQENVRARDWKDGVMPKLQERVAGVGESNFVQIPEAVVTGEWSVESVKARLEEACRAKGREACPKSQAGYIIEGINLPSLLGGEDERAESMKIADDAIQDNLERIVESSGSYVLIYITTPPARHAAETDDGQLYEMDDPYPSGLHTDLKRDMGSQKRQSDDGNLNMQNGLPLFEKYQFLSPALFMTLGVSILLLSILYVGISAISGLEVSYAAFSKEMGPQAQKGKQS